MVRRGCVGERSRGECARQGWKWQSTANGTVVAATAALVRDRPAVSLARTVNGLFEHDPCCGCITPASAAATVTLPRFPGSSSCTRSIRAHHDISRHATPGARTVRPSRRLVLRPRPGTRPSSLLRHTPRTLPLPFARNDSYRPLSRIHRAWLCRLAPLICRLTVLLAYTSTHYAHTRSEDAQKLVSDLIQINHLSRQHHRHRPCSHPGQPLIAPASPSPFLPSSTHPIVSSSSPPPSGTRAAQIIILSDSFASSSSSSYDTQAWCTLSDRDRTLLHRSLPTRATQRPSPIPMLFLFHSLSSRFIIHSWDLAVREECLLSRANSDHHNRSIIGALYTVTLAKGWGRI